ncbi:hypothetical protein IIE26_26775 (plasmid) [Cytobacillus oceanisediminis]|uniref:hypothetical protein n=1 Tax=Cytobacillus oceanisediminis TaxID=665099 RepID=UPI001863C239|nr:hypothetical protein [Cytobacillus oceanisediminis]QOK29975.1 hypothetical protein IIE26_26775 [Cytobacillus oceanisediminis]
MSRYKNIFHYYRGQSKGSTPETKQLQIENNLTKAFLNVLQHSSPEMTSKFLKFAGLSSIFTQSFEYRYQLPNVLSHVSSKGAVIGIAESDEVRNSKEKMFTIPDGAILSEDVSILIECKIGYNSYLTHQQLEGHNSCFAPGQQIKEEPIIITWMDIRNFFRRELSWFEQRGEQITCFLIMQFEEFCMLNSIGDRQKSKEYFFLHFEKEAAQKLAREVDHYICSVFAPYLEDAGTKDGIGYRKKGRTKFATLTTARQRCLILHIGRKDEKLGLQMQGKIDSLLGKKYDRKPYEEDKYPHEAYIRLEWVSDLQYIKEFINQAYNG